uniref:Glycosyltransferase n=1 Tax=Oryza rufipogon TaxID=4529 RepID=A0A0E0PPJ9_ORYRU
MASTDRSKKLRVLLIPFFATSHIGPFTDLAVRLVTARPDAVEPTIAVTPANVSVVRSALERHGSAATSVVSIATYPFPEVAGLPRGVENLSTAGADGWRIDVAATNEALTRPAQEALISGQSPDALITDAHFFWNAGLAEELGVPCVSFSVIGLFSGLAMRFVTAAAANDDSDSAELTLAGFPGAELRFPKSELPDFLIRQGNLDGIDPNKIPQGQRMCHGLAVNAFLGMEQPYRERFLRDGLAKRVYLVGPLSLPQPPAEANAGEASCIGWLDSKPSRSVLYEQLHELALGLEASGKPFLWAVRAADGWAPPAGWEERVGDRGLLVRDWVPQTAILSHPATAAFLTHCGSSSLLEAVAAGVPLLTWPLVFDQFIEERLVTDVLRIGERVWDGPRSVRHEEAMVVPAAAVARAVASVRHEEAMVVPAAAVARAVARFLEPGGVGDAARLRAQELAAEAHAAVAEGGSSYRDLRRLVDDMVEARAAGGEAAAAPQPQVVAGRKAQSCSFEPRRMAAARSVTLSSGRSGACLFPGLCVGIVGVWVVSTAPPCRATGARRRKWCAASILPTTTTVLLL